MASLSRHALTVVASSDRDGKDAGKIPDAGRRRGEANDDALTSRGTKFTAVGYGAQSVTSGPGGLTYHYADIRYWGVGTLGTVTPSCLHISGNPATGDAGTCYGDSGGPNFLGAGAGETRIVAGTTITGDAICRATNVDYRLDTPTARSFLADYVPLP